MADIQPDFAKTAEDLANLAKEAAYVAIGLGIIGWHNAQVRRHKLNDAAERAGDLQGSLTEARKELAKRVRELDVSFGQLIEAFDATLEPMWLRLPEPAQAVVQQARETRDQVRKVVVKFAA